MITRSNSLRRERDAHSNARCSTSHHVRYRAVPRTNRTPTTANTHNPSATSSTSEPPASTHRYLGNALLPTHRQVNVPTSPFRIASCRRLGRLHQQESQQGIALFADVPQSLLARTGVLTRNHPHIRADLLAAVKPLRSSDDQHVSQGRQWAHARMRHQPQHLGSLLGFLLGGSS